MKEKLKLKIILIIEKFGFERKVLEKKLVLEKEYLVRSNKNVGSWDWDLLGNDYDLDQLSEWGFSDKDFDFLLSDEEETTGTGAKKECQCPECGHKF